MSGILGFPDDRETGWVSARHGPEEREAARARLRTGVAPNMKPQPPVKPAPSLCSTQEAGALLEGPEANVAAGSIKRKPSRAACAPLTRVPMTRSTMVRYGFNALELAEFDSGGGRS